jgi:hypothetical protein
MRANLPAFSSLVVGLILSASASASAPISFDTVSSLNQRRDVFDGKDVRLKGYLWIGPEQLYIVDRKFDNDDAWQKNSGCLSLLNAGSLGSMAKTLTGKYVEITGRFVADSSSYGVSLMVCGSTGLDLGAHPEEHIKVIDGPGPVGK